MGPLASGGERDTVQKRLKIIEALHSQIQAHRTAGIKGNKVSRHNTLEIGSDESTQNCRNGSNKGHLVCTYTTDNL
jgi:hypothetical protein